MARGQTNFCYLITASASQAIGMTLMNSNFASICRRIISFHRKSSISNGANAMLRLYALRKTKSVIKSWAFCAPPVRRASLWIGRAKSSQVGASSCLSPPTCTSSNTYLDATCEFYALCSNSSATLALSKMISNCSQVENQLTHSLLSASKCAWLSFTA